MAAETKTYPDGLYGDTERLKLVERTRNNKGFMFLKIGESAEHWLRSLPSSSCPLLDIGAAFGVHTLHAMKAGRDVIAVDICEEHINTLKARAKELGSSNYDQTDQGLGRLVDAVVSRVPNTALFEKESIAGVLVSEVLQFLEPGEPLQLLCDIYKWLCPGGLVVVTAISGQDYALAAAEASFMFIKGRTTEQVREMLGGPEEVLIREAPTYMEVPDSPIRASLGRFIYLMTTNEMGAIARRSGFEILHLSYVPSGKYPYRQQDNKDGADSVFLVARKPL